MTATTSRPFLRALAFASLAAAAGCGKGADGAAAKPGAKGAAADRPIPVLVAEAVTRDVPITSKGSAR